MPNRVFRYWRGNTPGRRFFLALLLSLLVHLWLVGGLNFELPDLEQDEGAILVELVPVAKPAAPAPVAAPETPPAPAEPESPPEPPEPAEPEPLPQPETGVPIVTPSLEEPPAQVAKTAPEPEPTMEQALEESLRAGSGDAPSIPVEPEPEAKPQPPRHVEIDYQLVRKGGVAGVERHSYQAREDGSYSLTSIAEPKGLLALVLSDLVQKSEGLLTERGLRPLSYVYQYGKNADKAQKASFDWQAGVLTMEVGDRRQTVELADGTQDLMSFMYQFMFVPPLQEMYLAVTNGKKLKVYNYGFEGEETLEMKMGPLRTWHIGKSGSDGEEKTEIWLAADYHYLPVKIRKTEKDGTVTERIATRLQIE